MLVVAPGACYLLRYYLIDPSGNLMKFSNRFLWLMAEASLVNMIWMSLDFTDDQSTLVQVMAWCRQATSHYLSQCCPSSQSPHCVTRPQCVLVRKSSGTETEWNKTAYTEWWNNVASMIVKYNCPNTVNKGIYIDMVKLKIGHITITLCAILLIIYTQI